MANQVDVLLSRIGTGKWNLFQILSMAFTSGLPSPHAIAGPFVVPRLHHSCRHSSDGEDDDDAITPTNATKLDACYRWTTTEENDSLKEPCRQWDFDQSTFTNTVTAEYNLVCESEYIRALYMSLYMMGVLVASPSIGYLADRYGRKTTVMWGILAFVVLSNISGWLPNIPAILVCRFLIGMTHVPVTKISYILGMESTSPEIRSSAGMLLYLPWSLFSIFFSVLGYFIRDWRWLLTAASLPCLIMLPALWFLDESPHWLAVRGHYGRALQVLKKAARWNNVTLPPDDEVLCLLKKHGAMESKTKVIEKKQTWVSTFKDNVNGLFILFKTPRLRLISAVLHLDFFVVGMVYYGLAFSGGNFKINIFVYVALLGVMEIPSHTLMCPIVARFGRKWSLVLGFIFTGIVLLCITFVPQDLQWLVLTLAMLGRMNICVASTTTYLFGSELFPTEVRTRGITYSFMMSRVGSSIAPFITEYLGHQYQWAPLVVFGGAGIIGGLASMALRETLGTTLPDTIAFLESQDLGSSSNGIFKRKRNRHKNTDKELEETRNGEQTHLKEDC